ncbi:hypothetical protein [Paenibacillus pabuli]|nr:hypothetical protein [Paenibacillus pabuli]
MEVRKLSNRPGRVGNIGWSALRHGPKTLSAIARPTRLFALATMH